MISPSSCMTVLPGHGTELVSLCIQTNVSYDHHFVVYLPKKNSPKEEVFWGFFFNAHWFRKAYNSQNPICVKVDLK